MKIRNADITNKIVGAIVTVVAMITSVIMIVVSSVVIAVVIVWAVIAMLLSTCVLKGLGAMVTADSHISTNILIRYVFKFDRVWVRNGFLSYLGEINDERDMINQGKGLLNEGKTRSGHTFYRLRCGS